MYLPALTNARRVASYVIGPYIGVLLTDCEASGVIDYKHVLFVYLPDPVNPGKPPQVVMAVAAELSSMLKPPSDAEQPEAYFLGVFPGDGHYNLGMSEDWADLEKFAARAVEVARERLEVSRPVMRIPDDAGRRPHTDD